jgi:hypothetical protein
VTDEREGSQGVMRCLRCKSTLERSGKEPYRYICSDCGQHYFLQMQLVPVEAPHRTPLLEQDNAERSSGTE